MDENVLRALVDVRDRTIQKSRIAFSNRINAIERGVDIPSDGSLEIYERWLKHCNELEEEANNDIRKEVKGSEIVDRMIEVKGIGDILAAKVVSMVDIHKADTVSALWKYAGFGLGKYWQKDGKTIAPFLGWKWIKKDGEGGKKKKVRTHIIPDAQPDWKLVTIRDKLLEGWESPWNKRLKATCFLIGLSFLKSNSPYRRIYNDAREYYEAKHPDWTKLHQHYAAMDKMIKLWLSHLWLVWRQMEGLETRAPYVHEYLGHTHEYKPEEFGWSARGVK